jgi:hypothetical protein
LHLLQLRVITQALQRFAQACKYRASKAACNDVGLCGIMAG